MPEEKDILARLRNGEKIRCPECGQAFIEPYGTTADKAHCFECPNPECDWHAHWCSPIDIE